MFLGSAVARRYTQNSVNARSQTVLCLRCRTVLHRQLSVITTVWTVHSLWIVNLFAVYADPLLLERLAQMETELGSKSPIRDADGNVKKKTEDGEDDDEDEPIEEDEDDYQDDDDYYQVHFAATCGRRASSAYAPVMGGTDYLPVQERLLLWHCQVWVWVWCLHCNL